MVKNRVVAENGKKGDEEAKSSCGENYQLTRMEMIAPCGFLEEELRQCSK